MDKRDEKTKEKEAQSVMLSKLAMQGWLPRGARSLHSAAGNERTGGVLRGEEISTRDVRGVAVRRRQQRDGWRSTASGPRGRKSNWMRRGVGGRACDSRAKRGMMVGEEDVGRGAEGGERSGFLL